MTQRELVAAICARTALPEQTAREVLQVVIATIEDAVWDGDRVTLTNFGSFYLAERKVRTQSDGQKTAKKYPKFVPASHFEELVR